MTRVNIKKLLVLAGALTLVALAGVLPLWGGSLASIFAANELGPGLKLQIVDGRISDSKPVVVFRLTDNAGNPVALSDLDPNSLRFGIAHLDVDPSTGLSHWVNYITQNVSGRPYTFRGEPLQPALPSATQVVFDSGGKFVDRGGGLFTYVFGTTLPAGFDANATHRIGGQATRQGRTFVGNDTFTFVPSGGDVKTDRTIVTQAACNRCHDPAIGAHGGQRNDPQLCTLCHTSQTTDPETGRTVELKVMIHKIHRGENLPSVKAGDPYYIVGFNQNPVDFSDVAFPQDLRNCETCHNGPQGDFWKTKPSAAACTSCHDDVNPITGQNHAGGAQTDATCKNCHTPTGPEFGLSVEGSHTIPAKSSQLRGVNFSIVSVINAGPGQSPTVIFSIKDRAGNVISPQEMSSLSINLAGPTSDYTTQILEAAKNGAQAVGDGTFSYTFQRAIPSDATGTYAVGMEGYIETTVKEFGGKTESVRDVGFNPVTYVGVTDSPPLPRKEIVARNNCNVCHENLAAHGGTRQNTQYCVFCHNPVNNDIVKRTAAGGPLPPESIHFKRLIHKLHTGEDLSEEQYVIYGGPPANPGPVNLKEILFPADRRKCEKCHTPASQLPDFLHQGALPTQVIVNNQVVSSIPPITSACTSCHDSAAAMSHAESNTAPDGSEACLVCHGIGRDVAVSEVHKLVGP